MTFWNPIPLHFRHWLWEWVTSGRVRCINLSFTFRAGCSVDADYNTKWHSCSLKSREGNLAHLHPLCEKNLCYSCVKTSHEKQAAASIRRARLWYWLLALFVHDYLNTTIVSKDTTNWSSAESLLYVISLSRGSSPRIQTASKWHCRLIAGHNPCM